MGIFDRDSGVPPSGIDLYWHDELSEDDGGGGGDDAGGCSGKGCLTTLIIVVVIIAIWVGWVVGHYS